MMPVGNLEGIADPICKYLEKVFSEDTGWFHRQHVPVSSQCYWFAQISKPTIINASITRKKIFH